MTGYRIFRKVVIALGLLMSGYLAWMGIFSPVELMQTVGIDADTPMGRNEIRGQYGGFFAVLSLTFFLCLIGVLKTRLGIILIILLFSGVLLGRLLTLAIEGFGVFDSYSPTLRAFYIVDVIGLLLGVAALRDPKRASWR